MAARGEGSLLLAENLINIPSLRSSPWPRNMAIEGRDSTERFILAAKARAKDVLNEAAPKLTSLERGMWLAMKRRERPVKQDRAS